MISTSSVNENEEVSFKLTSDYKIYDNFVIDSTHINNAKYSVSFNFDSAEKLQVGYTLLCTVQNIEPIENEYKNPSSFDLEKYMLSKKIYFQVELSNCTIANSNIDVFSYLFNIRNFFIEKNNQLYSNASLINALVLGQKDFDEDELKLFSANNLLHLVTISGTHLLFIIALLDRISFYLHFKKNQASLFTTVILLLYSIVAGFSIAILRATILYVFKIVFPNTNTISLLCYICIVFLIINPFLVLNIGFILTFLISYLVMKFSTYSILKMSLVIQLVIFPLILNMNFEYNPLSIFSIILFTPLITYFYLPLSFISTIVFQEIIFVDSLIDFFYYVLDFFYFQPLTFGAIEEIYLIIYYILLIVSFTISYKFAYTFLLLFCILLLPPGNAVHFIDINQGKAIVITFITGEVFVIDSGSSEHSNELVLYLKYLGINEIDYYFITHEHEDHYGGTEDLISNFTIKNIYSSYNYQIPACNSSIKINESLFQILNNCEAHENINNQSLVIYAKLNDINFLFTGDIESDVEHELIKTYNLNVDVLDVAHHGSTTSSSDDFLNKVTPDYAVIQYGENNSYGHPNDDVIARLKEKNIKIYSPSDQGVIIFRF